MALSAGDKLGPYEIIALIGKGGMGEVYRAKDTRLGREVAVKISQEQFNERFEREARVVASLNHPNICSLYDVGPNYLVMEYVEGESPVGPLPIDEAMEIARQIAEALGEAHDKGVVHRDLKPANIKIKPDGTVKVLDFGWAKIGGGPATAMSEDSPTISMAATQAGVILGTAAYMAPEQARGKRVDARADIWAFGVVFYELITGQRLFKGEDLTDTLASVVKEHPDLSAVPPRVRRLLEECLRKDPKKRLQAIGDMRLLLEAAEPPPSPAGLVDWAESPGWSRALRCFSRRGSHPCIFARRRRRNGRCDCRFRCRKTPGQVFWKFRPMGSAYCWGWPAASSTFARSIPGSSSPSPVPMAPGRRSGLRIAGLSDSLPSPNSK